ncbi:MAG: PA domain-containing protein, partial [Actinomycetes bacterium]
DGLAVKGAVVLVDRGSCPFSEKQTIATKLGALAMITHPGPMMRGVEIASSVADLDRTLQLRQVSNGVATRMAVLFSLLGQGPLDSGTEQ